MKYSAFRIFVGLLFFAGIGLTLYKNQVLGFPLRPGEQTEVWEIEARIDFEAMGEAVRLSFALPEDPLNFELLEEVYVSGPFGLEVERGDLRRANWSIQAAEGPVTLFYRASAYRETAGARGSSRRDTLPVLDAPEAPPPPFLTDFDRTAAEAVRDDLLAQSSDSGTFAALLFQALRDPPENSNYAALLGTRASARELAEVARDMLALQEIPHRLIRGLVLEQDQRRGSFKFLIEVFDGDRWEVIDPETGETGLPPDFFVWQRGGRSNLDLEGGRGSEVSFSFIQTNLPTAMLARNGFGRESDPILDFSLYALPIGEQGVFKTLLLIPIGALALVFIRNVIGVSTSGTFMPILIAIAFQETNVLPGLVLFIVVVGVGLLIRSWLSRLNLLLVPRISAVVVVVILLMAALSIASHKLGLERGLTVTFFPTIILAWTIERLSILWEEHGQREALKLGFGSLLVAVVAHFFMDAAMVKYLTFAFPELLLSVLALILMIGQYSGYRLLELHRFRGFPKAE